MRATKKLLTAILVLAIIAIPLSIFTGCTKQKKAMIILPGIMGSALYDVKGDYPVWSTKNLNTFFNEADDIMKYLECDNNQVPLKDTLKPATMENKADMYGLLDLYKPLYDTLNKKYGEEYDVIVWQYDWRDSNATNADKLENFIKENKYSKVCLFSHSLGGCVVSNFLTKEANRKMTECYLAYSSPFLGCLECNYYVHNGYVSDADFDFAGFSDKAVKIGSKMFDLQSYLKNMGVFYEPFAFDQLNNAPIYQGEDKVANEFLKVNGKPMKTADYLNLMKNHTGFGFNKDGSPKPIFDRIKEYQKSHFVDGKHITTQVNSYYFYGSGTETLSSISWDSYSMKLDGTSCSTAGDGTILAFSARAGLPESDDRTILIPNIKHKQMVACDESMEKTLEILGTMKFIKSNNIK